jgi:biotin transport system substrate-specific component
MKTRQLVLAAVFAAIIAVVGPLALPLGVVPLTLQTLIIPLVATIASPLVSLTATGVYLLLGAIGMPVFTGFTSGVGHLFGPTGGYLFGDLLFPLIIGLGLKLSRRIWWVIVLNLIAAVTQLFVGTVWLIAFNQMAWSAGLTAGFTAFLIPAVIKVGIVVVVTLAIQRALSLPLGDDLR